MTGPSGALFNWLYLAIMLLSVAVSAVGVWVSWRQAKKASAAASRSAARALSADQRAARAEAETKGLRSRIEAPAPTPSDDLVLDRITFDPGEQREQLAPILWPKGMEPTPFEEDWSDGLPAADVVVITYTFAEARALADVLTPGVESTDWVPYRSEFESYLPMLTDRSPAKAAGRLGSWHLTKIGESRVLCFKSELHPATDGPELPLAHLVVQILAEARPGMVITTGTAGAVGAGTRFGDVIVAGTVRWDCQERFKDKGWAHAIYRPTVERRYGLNISLLLPNFDRLPADLRGDAPVVYADDSGLISTDFFAMGDTSDAYGLLKVDASCRAVDMDDAAVGLAMAAHSNVAWLSIRNASDPVMPGSKPLEEQRRDASRIYERWGYTTTIGSAICCWAVVAAGQGQGSPN